jgi:excisionase family DNA binding protein
MDTEDLMNKVKELPGTRIAPSTAAPAIEPALVSINDAAAYLGLGRTRVYELIAAREIDACRIGARTLVRVSSLKALADRAEPVGKAA